MEKSDLVLENMKLVHGILNKFYPTYAFDEDMIQCGMLGLCKAADTYNDEKGKFSTYACTVIRNEIRIELTRREKYKHDVSLSTPVSDEEGVVTLEDQLSSQLDVDYCDDKGMLAELTDQERQVVMLRSKGYIQEEIATELGISRSVVAMICAKVKSKWRDWK
jgi:RNA polymerase sporulation-specific sigma factor